MKVCLVTKSTVDNDGRALKESGILAEFGVDVVIVGLLGAQHSPLEVREGFCIKRVRASLGLYQGFTNRLYPPIYDRLPAASRKLARGGYGMFSRLLRGLDAYSKLLVTYVRLLKAMRRERAEYYHAHFPLVLIALTFLAAKVMGRKYICDFNDVLVLSSPRARVQYYEQEAAWGQELPESEVARIETTIRLMPKHKSASSALDVGCGDGRITNRLESVCPVVVGVDTSKAALRHVKNESLMASITALPFGANSFDLVLTTELLEHLPKTHYGKAIEEIKRVASSWILAGVPWKEQLRVAQVKCPVCKTKFHGSYHFRAFNGRTVRGLFAPEFELIKSEETGGTRSDYVPWLLWIKQYVGGIWARMVTTVCPECGSGLCPSNFADRNAIQAFCDVRNQKANKGRAKKSHIVALYQKA